MHPRTHRRLVPVAIAILVVGLASGPLLRGPERAAAPTGTAAGAAPILTANAVAVDISAPLRDIAPSAFAPTREGGRPAGDGDSTPGVDPDGLGAPEREGEGGPELDAEAQRERVMVRPPAGDASRADPLAGRGAYRRNGGSSPAPNAGTSGATTLATPTTAGSAWDGLGQGMSGFPVGGNYAPPDTSMDVSPTQIVEAVNVGLAIWEKSTGTRKYGPVTTNTLWSGFGGLCETTNDGDPTVVYDRLADRWVISQFALSGANGSSVPYLQCIAISTTSDALGSWYRYSFPYSFFPDYPKLAVWPNAYYTTFNGFTQQGALWGWYGAVVCAHDRTRMLAGLSATQQCWRNSSYSSILVAGVEGRTPPSDGTAAYAVALEGSTTLATWRYSLDWTTPANSRQSGPTSVGVASYAQACSGGTCIPQAGTTQQLDSLGERLMYRYVYRNNGGTESLLVSHSVSNSGTAAVRWYELRPTTLGGNPSLYQQGTFGADGTHRWMPSISMDGSGDIAIVYSASSSSLSPAIRTTGRLPGDPLGTLDASETTVVAGGGSQTGGLDRWGDYAIVAVDPEDECTFWAATEYLGYSGSFNWRTRIASFRFPSCTGNVGFSVSLGRAAGQQSPTNANPIGFSLTGNARIDAASVGSGDFTVTGGTLGTISCSQNTCSLPVTPTISNGAVSIAPSGSFAVSATSGDDATTATGSDRSVTYDTTAPTLTLARAASQPSAAYASPIVFSLTSGEALDIATVTTADFATTYGTVSSVSCPSATSCSIAVTAATDGTATITLSPSGAFSVRDLAGNATTTAGGSARTVTFTPLPVNGGFEAGLTGWTATPVSSPSVTVSSSVANAGSRSLQIGGPSSPFLGDASAGQTVAIPAAATSLRFAYRMVCNDRIQNDWATVTLRVGATTYTPLPRVCAKAKNNTWQTVTYSLPTAAKGQSAILSFVGHDDNQAADPSYVYYDAVSFQ